MFTSSAQASCRLTARRRLALGGVVLTTAIAAGAFVSTPAFAAGATEISSFGELRAALVAHDTDLKLTADLHSYDLPSDYDEETIAASTTLDLNGHDLSLAHIEVAAGKTFTVTDSQHDPDTSSNATLDVHARPSSPDAGPNASSGVLLGDDAVLHVSGAELDASGDEGGAGIGSETSDGSASVIADAGASVTARGGSSSAGLTGVPEHGGAGIGGSVGAAGISVTVADADVDAFGGAGAAGVGGGENGGGGDVHLLAGAYLDAVQSFFNGDGDAASTASAVGSGAGSSDLGTFDIARNATLSLRNDAHLTVPSGATVESRGTISMQSSSTSGDLVRGAGTIHNLGRIRAYDATSDEADPTTLIGSGVSVTGNNYAVTVDANGGSFQGTSSGRTLSGSLSDVIGYSYSNYTLTEPVGFTFVGWNTAADGTGIDVADDLSVAGPSTGTPKSVTLFAKYARVPYATSTSLPSGTVGTPYRAQLPVAGDGLAEYSVSYGNSSNDVHAGLPAGLTIDRTTGVISGTPTETLDGTVTFYVQGLGGADLTYRLTISPKAVVAAPSAPSAPSLGAVAKQTVKLGRRLSLQLPNTGGPATSYAVTFGSLPKGITLNASTGVISGTPTASGIHTAFIVAKSDAGSSSTQVQIVVPEVHDLLDTRGAVPAVKVGAAKVPLKVAGLKKGEHWTVKVDGKVVDRGTMKKAGTLAVAVKLKKARRDTVHTIVIAGSRTVTDKATRAATTVKVTSLAARKALRVHTVSANGTRLVAVEKLAAGERVVIKDGRKVIATGHANDFGIFAFPASKAGAGTSKVTVHGATEKRAGKLTVKNAKHSKH